jgi:hypothetical protein
MEDIPRGSCICGCHNDKNSLMHDHGLLPRTEFLYHSAQYQHQYQHLYQQPSPPPQHSDSCIQLRNSKLRLLEAQVKLRMELEHRNKKAEEEKEPGDLGCSAALQEEYRRWLTEYAEKAFDIGTTPTTTTTTSSSSTTSATNGTGRTTTSSEPFQTPDRKKALLLQEALRCYMKLLSIHHDVSQSSVMERLPFVLLHLKRYDDLYRLAHLYMHEIGSSNTIHNSWMLSDDQRSQARVGKYCFGSSDKTTKEACPAPQRSSASSLSPPSAYYSIDIVQEFGGAAKLVQSDHPAILALLVALFLMKLHLHAEWTKEQGRLKVFLRGNSITAAAPAASPTSHTSGRKVPSPKKCHVCLEQVSSVLQEFLIPSQEQQQLEQSRLVQLVTVIELRNPCLLPALLYPDLLKRQYQQDQARFFFFRRSSTTIPGHSHSFPAGCPMEAYRTLSLGALKAFQTTPGAQDLLQDRFGGLNPTYQTRPMDQSMRGMVTTVAVTNILNNNNNP